jgi:hypothetical protein
MAEAIVGSPQGLGLVLFAAEVEKDSFYHGEQYARKATVRTDYLTSRIFLVSEKESATNL